MITLQEQVMGVPPPTDWTHGKFKRVLRLCAKNNNTGMKESNLLSLSYGKIVPKDIESNEGLLPESFETYQIVDPGDIVLRLTDLQNDKRSLRQGLVTERGIVTSAYDAVRPKKDNDPRFWAYTLLALDLAKFYYSMGGGVRQSISFNDFPNAWIAVPDVGGQRVIADFLDRETARIDQLIAKKQRIANLICAKWAAMIHDARSELGTKWVRFNAVTHRVQRAIGSTVDTSFVPLGLYNRGRGFFRKLETDEEELGDSSFFWVRKGDIVFSGQFAWEGAIGFVTDDEDGCVVSHRYPIYRAVEGIESAYLYAFFRTAHGAFIMDNCSRGAAGRNKPLNTWTIEREQILIPSEKTQKAIARLVTLEAQVRKLTREYVSKALELRSALITAAVTGQIDVQAKLSAKNAQPDHAKFRVIVGAEIIHRHQGNLKFGHVKLQKLMFLAEVHAGISELQGNYLREAAGPYDRALIEGLYRSLEANGFYRVAKPEKIDEAATYTPLAKAGKHSAELKALLGTRTEALANLINLLSDFDKRSVEAIATLYAVWNDAMMDGQTQNDAAIINGVLTEWHSEKGEKFKDADLRHWLGWMKRNRLTPRGQGPSTAHTMTRSLFP